MASSELRAREGQRGLRGRRPLGDGDRSSRVVVQLPLPWRQRPLPAAGSARPGLGGIILCPFQERGVGRRALGLCFCFQTQRSPRPAAAVKASVSAGTWVSSVSSGGGSGRGPLMAGTSACPSLTALPPGHAALQSEARLSCLSPAPQMLSFGFIEIVT